MDLTKYNLIGLNDENEIYLNIFIVTLEIGIAAKRIKYFTYHLDRCIKDVDKIKLTVIVTSYAIQIPILLRQLVELRNDLISSLTKI